MYLGRYTYTRQYNTKLFLCVNKYIICDKHNTVVNFTAVYIFSVGGVHFTIL